MVTINSTHHAVFAAHPKFPPIPLPISPTLPGEMPSFLAIFPSFGGTTHKVPLSS